MSKQYKVCVIGLGYVGLPLSLEFGKIFTTVGFDINKKLISNLKKCYDPRGEVTKENLNNVLIKKFKQLNDEESGFYPTFEIDEISFCNVYIITVPTPTDINRTPSLTHLLNASKTVGMVLNRGDIVVYESTVYPGVTEDECVPVLEKYSNLKFNKDFHVGYSPERINPGDNKRTLTDIKKVVSGSTPTSAIEIDNLYKRIIKAGTYLAKSIKVAEASKVIENTQRDVNIAFVNELSKIFNLLNINTSEVLEAAQTKWNFLPFKPGLVGGHCIGVDPYYLAQKAQNLGYYPEIILSARRINDSMGKYIANQLIKLMSKNEIKIKNSDALILGFTFKENCSDIRNTRVFDLFNELKEFGVNVEIYDPLADKLSVKKEFGIDIANNLILKKYDSVILAVAHKEFKKLSINDFRKKKSVFYDIKGLFDNANAYL